MPERKTINRARQKACVGKRPTMQTGEFVREEIKHLRRGKHGARSVKQAIAIGLSKARRAGVPLPPPKKGTTPDSTRIKAEREYRMGQEGQKRRTSRRRSRATLGALLRENGEWPFHAKRFRTKLDRRCNTVRRNRGQYGARPHGNINEVLVTRSNVHTPGW